MESPRAYIPIDRRQAMASGQELAERTTGAALFADISGFTPLTEMLARVLGPRRGAEELTVYLNQIYDALITELHRYRGSVINFSGDAITCWFDGDEGLRSVTTALAMQQAMTQFANLEIPGGGAVSLAIKAAVAIGAVRRFVVGDPRYTMIDTMAGITLERLAAAEHEANKGEVIIDGAAAEALGEALIISEWRGKEASSERFAVVAGLNTQAPADPWPELAPDALTDEQTRPWVLPAVYRRLIAGKGEFLAELRSASALFLRFGGIDYDKDPDAPQKLDAYIRQVEAVLEHYDGSLLQLTIGDKGSYLYAAFGAPNSHEDDVDRAASAALELQALSPRLDYIGQVQIGITQGRMRVGAYGGQNRRTYGVLGDATNLSARLMQAAEPGQILVSDEAYARAGSSFVWENLPAIRVKGKSEPVALKRLVGLRKHQTGPSLTDLYPLPPVGRSTTLSRMEQALSELLAGHGQILHLMGEPGMGKSHLAAEFSRRAYAQPVRLAVGVCQSISRSNAYTPWRQIFNALLGMEEGSEDQAVHMLERWVNAEHPEWSLRLPLLSDLLGLPIPDNLTTAALDSDLRQKLLFSLLVEMIQFWAAQKPLAILIENAQWMDEASLALTQVIAQQASGTAAVLVLVIQRLAQAGETAMLPKLAALGNYQEMILYEMPEDEMALLIERHLGGHTSLLLQTLVQRLSRGNPFFIIELLEAMHKGGQLEMLDTGTFSVSHELLSVLQTANLLLQVEGEWKLKPDTDLSAVRLNVPDSIQGLVLSRIDRLPEELKLTLKVSSVIGYTIDLLLVSQAHPDRKDIDTINTEAREIEAQEIIHQETQDQLIYAFRHHSSQEVIYETLLYQQRQQLHQLVALVLAERHPEAVTQIAHHAYMGQAWPLALRYNFLAGETARQLHANQQSMDFYNKALRCTAELPENETNDQRKLIHLALGELMISAGDHDAALAHLDEALTLTVLSGDIEAQARVFRWYGRSFELRGNFDQALDWLDKGLEVLKGHVSSEEAELLLTAGLIHQRQGQAERTRALCERSLEVARQLGQAALQARAYNVMGMVDLRTHPRQAIEKFQLSLSQYEQLGNILGQANSHNLIANGHFAQNEWALADQHYRSALDLYTQLGNLYNQVLVSNNLGGIALKQGRFEAALAYYQRAVRLLQQTGGSLWVFGALYLNTGHVYIRLNQITEALKNLDMAKNYLDRAGVRELLPELYGLFAEATWLQENLQAASEYGQSSLELARELSMPREYGHNLRIMGEIYRAQAKTTQALECFQKGYDILVEAGDEYESAKIRFSQARLLEAEKQWQSAFQACSASEAVFARIGNQSDLAEARQLRQALEARQDGTHT